MRSSNISILDLTQWKSEASNIYLLEEIKTCYVLTLQLAGRLHRSSAWTTAPTALLASTSRARDVICSPSASGSRTFLLVLSLCLCLSVCLSVCLWVRACVCLCVCGIFEWFNSPV